MRALVQRVTDARVTVLHADGDAEVVGEIGPGLLVLVGVTHDDDAGVAAKLAHKIWHLRIFADGSGQMNLGLSETSGAVLVVSQFTLYGDTRRGRRPSWIAAAPPEHAAPIVEELAAELERLGARVQRGRFGAEMHVGLTNDGPVTLMLEI